MPEAQGTGVVSGRGHQHGAFCPQARQQRGALASVPVTSPCLSRAERDHLFREAPGLGLQRGGVWAVQLSWPWRGLHLAPG